MCILKNVSHMLNMFNMRGLKHVFYTCEHFSCVYMSSLTMSLVYWLSRLKLLHMYILYYK